MADPPRLAIFLATSGHSGVDRVMTNLIGEFARRGVSIDLVQIANHGPFFATLPAGVRRIDLGTAHVASSFGPLARYLRRERPAALLTDKDRLNRMALWARRLTGVPTRVAVRVGTTVSENLARRGWLQRRLQYASIRLFYPWADAILVPSQGVAEDLARAGRLDPRRISVVPSPIAGERLRAQAAEPASHPWFDDRGVPVVLGVGELCARKDFATLIRAFARLRGERPCRLIILGEGRQRPQLESLVRELGIDRDVALPGFVPNPYADMARAALFVLSSRCEGAPVVLMEALAVGVPVVATDCPSGPREILRDGTVGALAPIGDDAALARSMAATLAHPPAAAELRAAAAPFSVAASARAYAAALGLELPA
ncbi:MAG TPA: glycosyltransferase [Thermoanaerobaculia bacterium]